MMPSAAAKGTEPSWLLTAAVAGFIWAASLGAYLATLPPSITWSNDGVDSGDFAVAVHRLTPPHPTGYPTYVLLGKVFSIVIPIGDVAHRLNLMSAILASLAVLLVYLCVRDLAVGLGSVPDRAAWVPLAAGAVASTGFAFSSVFWSQATIAEVHALQAFLLTLLIYLLVRASRARLTPSGSGLGREPILLGAALLFGLSLGNHVSALLMLLPGAILLWRFRPGWRILASLALLTLMGLAVYAFLPLRGASDATSWGDPRSPGGFWWIVSGGPYRHYAFGLPLHFLPSRIGSWANMLLNQFNGLGLALALLGLAYLWQSWQRAAAAFSAYATAVVVFALFYDTTDSYLYLIPFFLLMAICLGLGIAYFIGSMLLPWLQQQGREARQAVIALVAIVLISIPALSLARNFSSHNLSQDTAALDYARAVAASTKSGAIVIADTDPHIFSLWYYRYVKAPNWDASVVSKGLLQYRWYWRRLREDRPDMPLASLEAPYGERLLSLVKAGTSLGTAVYITDEDEFLGRYFTFAPEGRIFRLLPLVAP